MATIHLIRHGMTDVAGKQLAGWTPGVFLNEEGREQVQRLGAQLKQVRLLAVYSSPLERTVETARALAGPQGIEVQIRERIGEVRYGEWTGKWAAEVDQDPRWRRWNSQRAEARCPGGESMLEIQARVVDELLEIGFAHPDQHVAVVSHGDPIRAAVAYFLGTPLELVLRIEIDPASDNILQIEEWGVKVKGVNLRDLTGAL